MAQNDFVAETPDNFEQKCLCVLVLDVSGSMVGEPIAELNRGLQTFYYQIMKDETAAERLEVCLITFESKIRCVQEPALLRHFQMPALQAGGSTRLAEAVKEAIIKVNYRKIWYRKTGQPYYRPFIFLFTDGEADADQDLEQLMFEINQGVNEKKFTFFPIGVQEANMEMLRYIAHPNTPPMKLMGLNFVEFFQWLSNSVGVITHSQEGVIQPLPEIGSWGQISI
ncbi:MAG: VWA domain-containing protein [Microscillaceae bacterium]